MAERLDDEPPVTGGMPHPGGWFEPMCCAVLVIAFVAVLVLLAFLH